MLASPLLLLVALLLSGVAVFLALGVTATTLLLADGHAIGGIAQALVDRLNSATLTAIPFFVTAATFMQRGGMATALVTAAQAWVGGRTGGLAFVVVVAAALFASVSGSSTATALALATILLPAMAARGYPVRFNCGVIGASATLGILLPPSLALIIFGLVATVPIPKLFLAGLVPALLQAVMFLAWISFATRRMPRLTVEAPMSLRERFAATMRALPALAVPAIALGGIYSGIVTLSEASALAAVTSIAICWANGSARWLVTIEWLGDAIKNSTKILVIVGFAVLLGHWIILAGIPEQLVDVLRKADISALQFLILMNVTMFALGMFLDVISTILITVPMVLPLLGPLGINPIHYAIVVIVNMEVAALTPPVGLNLYVMTSVSKQSLIEVVRGIAPFVVLLIALLAAVTAIPELSLWLPENL
jgi:C4-dicarboxylate transporter DctM subunit